VPFQESIFHHLQLFYPKKAEGSKKETIYPQITQISQI